MTNEEAYEYLRRLMGCASKPGEDCLCKEDCTECEYDYESDKWEDAISTAIEALEKQNHFYTQVLSKIDDIVYDHTDDGGYKNIMSEIYELLGLDWSEVD